MKIWGTSPESIDEAEDRDKWYKILTRLDIKQPPGDMVVSEEQALVIAQKLGYPVMVRPSFVLGGRAMEIVYTCAPPHSRHKTFRVCFQQILPSQAPASLHHLGSRQFYERKIEKIISGALAMLLILARGPPASTIGSWAGVFNAGWRC